MIDDFAHNADKIAAAITTAKLRAEARARRSISRTATGRPVSSARDFVATFARELGRDDRLCMLEVFYAGGTATRDFSAADIVAEIAAHGADAEFAPSRELACRADRRGGPSPAISCWSWAPAIRR